MTNRIQTNSGAIDERADAERVDSAVRMLHTGDIATAEKTLNEVVARIPDEYVFQFEQDGRLFIKFWDQNEFLHYVLWQKKHGVQKEITWIGSAYPRVCYYLGFLNVKRGEFDRATDWLDRGAALEPTNPKFRFEKAQALLKLKRHQEALLLYESVDQPGPYVSPHNLAMALRGKGFALIEMGSLDPAEAAFLKSLELEPGNKIAQNELNYIASLRRGGTASATQSVTTSAPAVSFCAVCGLKSVSGRLVELDNKPTFVCDRCVRKLTKRWWQFWK